MCGDSVFYCKKKEKERCGWEGWCGGFVLGIGFCMVVCMVFFYVVVVGSYV